MSDYSDRTKITEVPVPQTVNASTNVILHCSATTDTEEKRKLKVDWLKNNEKIDFNSGISKNTVNNALIITQAQVSDSGNYTCNASNGLDSDTVTVKVTVKGKQFLCHITFQSYLATDTLSHENDCVGISV